MRHDGESIAQNRRHRSRPGRSETVKPLRRVAMTLLVAFALAAAACSADGASTGEADVPEDTGSSESADVSVDPGTDDTSPPEPPAGDPAVALEWTESGLSGEAMIDQLLATPEGFIAYQTYEMDRAWTSLDGGSWTEHALVFEGATEELRPSSIGVGGLGYFAIGDGPVEDAVDDEVMWTSEDGITWSIRDIDLENPGLGVFAAINVESVTVGSTSLVLKARLDREGGPDEHKFVVWASGDGSDWVLIEDAFPSGAYIGDILAGAPGFVTDGFVEGVEDGDEIWSSSDGRSWDPVDVGPLMLDVADRQGLAVWNDKILTAANTEDGVRLWVFDGGAWQQLPASPALQHTEEFDVEVGAVDTGPYGIVLTGTVWPAPTPLPPVVLEKDGLVVSIDLESDVLTVTDASTGEVLIKGRPEELEDVLIFDDESFTVVHPGTGAETTFTFEEFDEAQARAFAEAGITGEDLESQEGTAVLWFSPAGLRWTTVGIEDTFGTAEPPEVVVGNDSVILRWGGFAFEVDEVSEDEEESAPAFAEDLQDLPDVIWVGKLAS